MPATFLGIDTETTGLRADLHQVIEIYLRLMDEKLEPLDELHVFAHPDEGANVDAKAIEINGYTREKWDAKGAVSQDTLAQKVYNFVSPHKRLKCIAHNAAFDTAFLARVYGRHAMCYPDSIPYGNCVGYHHLDTIPITMFLDMASESPLRKSYSLVNLSSDHNIPHAEVHTAKSDLDACIQLFKVHLDTVRGKLQPVAVVEKKSNGYSRIIKQIEDTWVFQYGQHVNKKVAEVAKESPGYINYVLGFNDLDPQHRSYLEQLV